ncbi:peptidase C12, ubiquitin carboxyl-terminal hydrolase [Chlamydoabsidia padenii]|nr:peptidase C12, ubiquitin carboxyl-terminal hydrolase [Chlamydoabsidia padenii]
MTLSTNDLPLEANVEVWNKIIHDSGVSTKWKYTDIHGVDSDKLSKIPPSSALILLFPSTDKYNDHIHEEEVRLAKLEQSISPNVVFFKQTVQQACGMIALLHSLANNSNSEEVKGPLFDFIEKSRSMSPDERAEWLKESNELRLLHEAAAATLGDHPVALLEDGHTDFHYVCFVEVDDHLYELDGRRPLPVNHGKTTDFVQSSTKVIKQYMDIDPNQHDFSMIALVESQ